MHLRASILFCCTAVLLPLALSSLAQSTAPNSTAILSQAGQAFSAGKPVASVEMTGTAQWLAGPTKDTGPVKLTAKTTGENSAEFDLSNGTRIETQSAAASDRTCSWSGKDGVSHDVVSSNCWTATIWFLPHLALQSTGLPTALGVQYAGVVAGATQSSPHIHHQLTIAPGKTKQSVTAQIQTWSKTDLSLDSATLLPSVLKYTIHPDNNSSVDVPVEVRYTKYQNVSGAELPMHIERYVNGSLQLSIDINSAAIN
jgi:hypothetical protein